MYYIIDGDEDNRYTFEELCNYIFDSDNYDNDDDLDEWINEIYYDQKCEIGGSTFYPADIVKELDDYTYRELREEWAEQQAENDRDYYAGDIENLEPGESEWILNWKVECRSEEEEEEEDDDVFNEIISVAYTVKTVSNAPTPVQIIK